MRAARQARAALSRASRRAIMAAAVALGATLLMGSGAHAAPAVGQKAPDFVAVRHQRQAAQAVRFRRQVRGAGMDQSRLPLRAKHYNSGNMPATQKAATDKGVVWLPINSTERAASDYLQPAALDAWMKERRPPHRHPDGRGRHDRPGLRRAHHAAHVHHRSARACWCMPAASTASPRRAQDDIKTATNYVNQALGEAFGGKPISAASHHAPTAARSSTRAEAGARHGRRQGRGPRRTIARMTQVAPTTDIGALLARTRTIAVVGLSPRPHRISYGVSQYMRARGFRIVPVNPNTSEVFGEKAYPTLTEAAKHEKIDLVNVFRNAPRRAAGDGRGHRHRRTGGLAAARHPPRSRRGQGPRGRAGSGAGPLHHGRAFEALEGRRSFP